MVVLAYIALNFIAKKFYSFLLLIFNLTLNLLLIIILYCSSGNRSKNACKKLIKKGYTNIYNLYGGIEF